MEEPSTSSACLAHFGSDFIFVCAGEFGAFKKHGSGVGGLFLDCGWRWLKGLDFETGSTCGAGPNFPMTLESVSTSFRGLLFAREEVEPRDDARTWQVVGRWSFDSFAFDRVGRIKSHCKVFPQLKEKSSRSPRSAEGTGG